MSDSSEAPVSGAGCLIRSLWMFAGNALLAYLLFSVVHNPSRPVTGTGLVFAATVIAMVLIRYIDVRFMRGETADGKPATMANWRRYAVLLVVAASLLWCAAIVVSQNTD